MVDQEFRQPQFSEDSAWLPTWLQAHFLEFGMQPGNNDSTSKIECKALGGLLESIRRGEEAACCSVSGQQICSLNFSGDGCTASDRSQSIENEQAIHLSLSSENDVGVSSTKASAGPLQEKYHCNVNLDRPEFVNGISLNLCSHREARNFKDVTRNLMRVNVLPGEKFPAQDESTPCTELYVPENIQQGDNTDSNICGDDYKVTDFATKPELLDGKTILSSAHGALSTETFVHNQIVMGNDQNISKQKSGKKKQLDKREGQLRNKTSDIDAAIGLTVAAAEALVISDLVETCRLSENIGSSEILEAAIKLRQARQMCGLDTFLDFSSESMDGVDNFCLDDLDDDYMEGAFADVGLFVMQSTEPSFVQCSADVFQSEDSKRITDKKKSSILSAQHKIEHPSEGIGFTPSKLELKVPGSDDMKDGGVLVSLATSSFSDSGDRRFFNGVVNTNGQQRDSMGKAQIILKHAVGSTINHDFNTKQSEGGFFITSLTISSENSLDKDTSALQLEQNPPFMAFEEYDKDTSSETQFPSIENLVQCSYESANETVEIVAATPQCDNGAFYKVRTTKFLYGCAVGTLLLQSSWITDSIAEKCCLPFDKYQLQSNASTLRTYDKRKQINEMVENAMPLFSGMAIMLYGKPTFYSKLMILIKHGGGLVFRTIKSLIHGCESGRAASGVIIVENVRAAPRHLRQCAAEYKLPVMSGNWVVESLLLGQLLPFRTNVSSCLQSLEKRGFFKSLLKKKPSRCRNITDSGTASVLEVKGVGAVDHKPPKNVKDAFSKEHISLDGLSIVCSSKVSAIPFAVPKLGIKLPGKYAELPAKWNHQENYLYYQYLTLNGVRYSVGDVVEIEPICDAKGLCFARVECLWSKQVAKMNHRSHPVGYSSKRMFLHCRWFYQPSDTGFPCSGFGKEIYFSNHFAPVPVSKIKRIVSIVFMVEGKMFPLNGPCEAEMKSSSCPSVDDQIADFVCKFFYDHENESLHQIKFIS